MLLRQLGVCLWGRAEAFYHGRSVCALGKGVCPACWPITPCKHPSSSQTPCGWQLYCQKEEKTSSSVFLFFVFFACLHLPVCVAFPPSPPSRTCQTKFSYSGVKLINCATRNRILFPPLSGFIVRVRVWQQIRAYFSPLTTQCWLVCNEPVRLVQKILRRDREGGREDMLGEDLLQIR